MIKYIPNTGIGILICSIVHSQHLTTDAEPVEIKLPENSFNLAVPVAKNKNSFDWPGQDKAEDYTDILYDGTVKRHRLNGSWQSWYSNQNLCDSGTFVKGVPDGEWKHWNSDGQLLAIRNYNADKMLRIKNEMRRSHPKNVLYPLVLLFNKNSRLAKQYLEAAYSFAFKGHCYYPHQLSLEQAVEINIAPGSSYRPVFDECLHHGLYMNFFADGNVKDSGYYKNGLRDGIWIHRDAADNSYLLGAYKNGVRQNDWKQYDAKDRLKVIIFYNRKGEEEWKKRIRE